MLVTLGATYDKKAPHHIEDAKTIYDYFMNNYGNQIIVNQKEPFKTIKSKYTEKSHIKLYPTKNITMYLQNDYNKKDIKYVYEGKTEVSPFNKKGEKLGTLKIYYQNKLIDTQNITLNQNLNFNIFSFFKEEVLVIGIIILIILAIFLKKYHKKIE